MATNKQGKMVQTPPPLSLCAPQLVLTNVVLIVNRPVTYVLPPCCRPSSRYPPPTFSITILKLTSSADQLPDESNPQRRPPDDGADVGFRQGRRRSVGVCLTATAHRRCVVPLRGRINCTRANVHLSFQHMNLVLADTEEFRRIRRRQAKPAAASGTASTSQTIEQEEKRTLGLTIVRGAQIVSLSVESPPPADPSARLGKAPTGGVASGLTAGPGVARPAGRGAVPISLAVGVPYFEIHPFLSRCPRIKANVSRVLLLELAFLASPSRLASPAHLASAEVVSSLLDYLCTGQLWQTTNKAVSRSSSRICPWRVSSGWLPRRPWLCSPGFPLWRRAAARLQPSSTAVIAYGAMRYAWRV